MKLNINGEPVFVNWDYSNLPLTICTIHPYNADGSVFRGAIIGSGFSRKRKGEDHNKKMARLISFGRAIKIAGFNKSTRADLLGQYQHYIKTPSVSKNAVVANAIQNIELV